MNELFAARLAITIRQKREGKGLTQQELADICGVSVVHLSHIENAQAAASVEIICRICKALQITPDTLLNDAISTL